MAGMHQIVQKRIGLHHRHDDDDDDDDHCRLIWKHCAAIRC